MMYVVCSRLSYLFWISIIEVFSSVRQWSIFSSRLSSIFIRFVYNNKKRKFSTYNWSYWSWICMISLFNFYSSVVESTNDENMYTSNLCMNNTMQTIQVFALIDLFFCTIYKLEYDINEVSSVMKTNLRSNIRSYELKIHIK